MQNTSTFPILPALRLRLAGMLTVALLCPLGALAQTKSSPASWKPNRPVTLIIPYNAGGGTDATARVVARRLAEIWQQSVVVENLGGADGLIGTRKVMDATPDGHTLLMQVPSLLLMKHQSSSRGIDPLSRLEPVSAIAMSPAALVVSGKLPVRTFSELIAYCRQPGHTCAAGSGENSSKVRAKHFADQFKLKELVVVNYKGTGPIVTDLVAGNITMAFTGLTAALPLHKTGQLRVLVTNGDQRASALPDVPTSAEGGWPDSYSVTWYGVFAPKGTPAAVTTSIAQAIRETGKYEDVQNALRLAGADPRFSTPKEFAAQIARDDAMLSARVAKYPLE
jgi:tripartite-type tricarboxylate transporter receptor subunit TctC